jgi:hypothetical protein
MKTGFINAFANKQVKKQYYYHGILRYCNKPPNPKPFLEELTEPASVNFWELIWDKWPPNAIDYWKVWNDNEFLPSVQDSVCFPAVKKRYYYSRSDIYYLYKLGHSMEMEYADGLTCTWHKLTGLGNYFHYETNVPYLHGQYYLMGWHHIKPPSHLQIWRSSTGELPNYIP